MRMRHGSVVVLVVGLLVAWGQARAEEEAPPAKKIPRPAEPTGEKLALKLNLKEGDVRKMTMDVDMDASIELAGVTAKMKMGAGVGCVFQVEKVDDEGNHSIKMTYERMRLKVSSNGQAELDFDSAKAKNPTEPAEKMLQALVGESLVFELTPQGHVTEMRGMEELAKNISRTIPGSEAALKQQLKETGDQLGLVLAIFPEKAVDHGDTWTATMKQGTIDPMTIDSTYTLLDRKDGEALIGVSSKIGGAMTGTARGTMNVDLETGWTRSSNITMEMSAEDEGEVKVVMKVAPRE